MSDLLAFKVAFISRCAEEGLTLSQINDRVKTAVANAEANYGVEKKAWIWPVLATLAAGLGIGAGTEGIKNTVPYLTGAAGGLALDPSVEGATTGALIGRAMHDNWGTALAGTGAVLAGGGLLAGRAMAQSKENPDAAEEIKHKELLNEYSRLTDRTRKATRQRRLLQNRG